MRDDYDPPTDPAPWQAFQAPAPTRSQRRVRGEWPFGESLQDPPGRFAGPDEDARSTGLRRLSRLTWRATQLSAITAVGFATLFSHTAQAHTVGSQTPVKPSVKPSSTSPSPSPTHRKRHHKQAAATAPAATTAPAASAPSPTLAAPSTAPAPPPPPPSPTPSPAQTTSGGSGGG